MKQPHEAIARCLLNPDEVREAAAAIGCGWRHLDACRLGKRRLHASKAETLAQYLTGKGHAITPAEILGVTPGPNESVAARTAAAEVLIAKSMDILDSARGLLRQPPA